MDSRVPTAENGVTGERNARPRGASRLVRAMIPMALSLPLVLLVAGFIEFTEQVSKAAPPPDPRADAIVVLTGGAARIDGAFELLAKKRAQRMLISGVNPEVTERDVALLVGGNFRDDLACCVDLGRDAIDTIGNAAEARNWAKERGFSSLIVVTSDYHMPRSMTELAGAMPDVTLIPYPVASPNLRFGDWWHNPGTFGLLAREYGKYVLANARQYLPSGTFAAKAAP